VHELDFITRKQEFSSECLELLTAKDKVWGWLNILISRGCTERLWKIQSFISPTNAQPICFKILRFTLKYTINAPTCYGLTKPSSGSLQYVLR